MARRSPQTAVRLNVYDLSDANDYISYVGLGLYHTGVEVAGDEYSFASGAGIFASTPRQAPGARFRESIDMGMFPGTAAEARNLAFSLRPDFDGATYNLFTKNCNTFSDALCQLLVNRPIPAHINRAAYFGSFLSCLMPDDVSNQAPVGDTSTGTRSSAPPRRSDFIYSPFAGSGMTLGGASDSTSAVSSSSNDGSSSLSDRRDKVRMAALQRLQSKHTEGSS